MTCRALTPIGSLAPSAAMAGPPPAWDTRSRRWSSASFSSQGAGQGIARRRSSRRAASAPSSIASRRPSGRPVMLEPFAYGHPHNNRQTLAATPSRTTPRGRRGVLSWRRLPRLARGGAIRGSRGCTASATGGRARTSTGAAPVPHRVERRSVAPQCPGTEGARPGHPLAHGRGGLTDPRPGAIVEAIDVNAVSRDSGVSVPAIRQTAERLRAPAGPGHRAEWPRWADHGALAAVNLERGRRKRRPTVRFAGPAYGKAILAEVAASRGDGRGESKCPPRSVNFIHPAGRPRSRTPSGVRWWPLRQPA
jgi:hypothetical protein